MIIKFNDGQQLQITLKADDVLWAKVVSICEACNKEIETTKVQIGSVEYNACTVVNTMYS